MGSSGRVIGLTVVMLAVAAGTAVTVAMASREAAAPDPAAPTTGAPSANAPGSGQLAGPPALLPNLRSLAATDLQVQRTADGRLLRFSASLANLGPGPLLVRPRPARGGCPTGQHPAAQVLHRDVDGDGAYQPEEDLPEQSRHAGCMLAHPTHDHWHFDAMAGYSLRSPTTGQRLATRRKVSFCLRDNQRIRAAETLVELLVRPRPARGGCPRGQHPAAQVLHRDVDGDGAYEPGEDLPEQSRHAGCMLAHPTHDHWHFDAMAGYSLRSPTTDQRLATRAKVSFCLRDNRRIDGVETSVRREHFGECTRTGPQGISPGWQDAYLWDLPGQTLPLPAGPGRRVLCLDLTADPRDLLAETDETDNGTSITVVVTDTVVQLGPRGRCDAA